MSALELIEVLNKKFNHIRSFAYNEAIVTEKDESDGYEDSPTEVKVCKLSEELFIKFKITSDSYGDNEQITGIQFVKPKVVTVTQFEPVC